MSGAAGAHLAPWAHVLVGVLVAVGMLVVVPLGLRLVDRACPVWLTRWWSAGAGAGAVALWLPRGWPAAALAAGYVTATGALLTRIASATAIAGRLRHGRLPGARDVAVGTALAAPTVAGTSLVAERAGYRLFGFDLDVLALTVAHFHYAGFAAALVAGLVCRLAPGGRAGSAAALSVPAGTAIVFAGYFTGDEVELAGAVVLTGGMWLVARSIWRQARPAGPDPLTRTLLAVCALVLAATMLLAVDWALGEATGAAHLPLSWMVATHGVANALGFALCGLLAWRRLPVGPVRPAAAAA
ncbi:YndJ family protein [Planosporangium sp. 12N6]|uniref:YndJ family protein n=1 Tax=Planosporangium spinosum TaxID=3402278 RepID=UPI003CF31F1D